MTLEQPTENWRQVRAFIKDFANTGFASFHRHVTLPVLAPSHGDVFFISHYACADHDDDGDTLIKSLPSNFRRPDNCHHSIRIRFRASDDLEERLIKTMPQDCWYSEFRDYDVIGDLAGERFCDFSPGDTVNRKRRALIISNLLCYSTRLYLDTIRSSPNGLSFEVSSNVLNTTLKSPYQSVLHMILNPPLLADKVVGLISTPQGHEAARL